MTVVEIKYNPYKLETEIKIDGEITKEDSKLSIQPDTRLQTWVEELPERLRKECNSTKVKIKFHGTTLDYEDVVEVAARSKNEGMEIECEHEPAKEAGDKIKDINDLFKKIKDNLFIADEKASKEYKKKIEDAKVRVEKAFKQAEDNRFEVAVIATMSSGKSTLINALLHQKIMPAKQEACTAIITRITDCDELTSFEASAYDKNGDPVGVARVLDNIKVMEDLNSNPQVCRVEVEGNIPFVSAKDTRLVLVDTPGPNTARDPEHKKKTYEMLGESTKTLVLYIMNGTQLAINDDNALLEYVSEQTKVGGKQSKDRFIFVINKLDDFKSEDGDNVDKAIENVKNYLKDHGIEDPNIYPASAWVALNIHYLLERRLEMGDDARDETEMKVRKFNRNAMLHFETKAQLTPRAKDEIESQLDAAKKADKEVKEAKEALIHTGIIPIENAIKAFVEKYAKSAKIKNLVDTFNKELEGFKFLEELNEKIDTDENARKKVLEEIGAIKKKLGDGQEAKKFKKVIDDFDCYKKIKKISEAEVGKVQAECSTRIAELAAKGDLTPSAAAKECSDFVEFANGKQTGLEVNLDREVVSNVKDTANGLVEQYTEKLQELVSEVGSVSGPPIISLKELMAGDVKDSIDVDGLVSSLTEREDVMGLVKNTAKGWYKPWTWFAPKEVRGKTGERKFIKSADLARDILASIELNLGTNREACVIYSKEQTDAIKKFFKDRFDELDNIIKVKTSELERRAKDKENIAKRIEESKERQKWIIKVTNEVEKILEI